MCFVQRLEEVLKLTFGHLVKSCHVFGDVVCHDIRYLTVPLGVLFVQFYVYVAEESDPSQSLDCYSGLQHHCHQSFWSCIPLLTACDASSSSDINLQCYLTML